MQYVSLGTTGLEVSRLGLGSLHLPEEESEAVELIRYAIDQGINYIDTAYTYAGSEDKIAKALRDGYRDKVVLVSKSPTWNIDEQADLEKYLDIQLKRLGVDYIDVYQLHNLYDVNWQRAQRAHGYEFLQDMKKKGKIGFDGFSIHGTIDTFKTAADAYPWEVVLIQLNILDAESNPGVDGLLYGASKGAAMAIMEPLKGGRLVSCMPECVSELLEAYPEKRSIVEWAFRWLYDKPEVSVVLSGASTLDQLKDSLRIFENAHSGCMSEADQELIVQIRNGFEAKRLINCTACGYCMPCAQGVAIPEIFGLYNRCKAIDNLFNEKVIYTVDLVEQGHGANQCTECGECERMCPQSLPIIESLKTAAEELVIPRKILNALMRDKA